MSIDENKLRQEWVDMSGPWIEATRKGASPNRIGLLDEPMLELCGNVNDLTILDSGCGEGRFSRILSKLGARQVLGVDLCEPMIREAKSYKTERVEYILGDVQNMDYLKDETFDVAVSYLNQCDIPDFEKNTKEVHRVLKKQGRFIIANLHPMRSAVGQWLKTGNGEKEHVILDRYNEEGQREWEIMGVKITNFHRTLSTYVNTFIKIGFSIKKIVEPTVTKENLLRFPQLEDELRVPNFIIFELKKVR